MKKLFSFWLIAFLLLGSGLVFFNLRQVKTPIKPSLPEKQMITEPQASISLVPQQTQLTLGQKLSLEIKVAAENLFLSGIALRLSYSFNEIPALQPQNTRIQPNANWQKQDWIYPVNKAWIDWQNKTVNFELAAVNPSLTGFHLNGEDSLGTIELTAKAPIENLIIDFDSEQTKVTTKDNQKVKLDFKTGVYKIK